MAARSSTLLVILAISSVVITISIPSKAITYDTVLSPGDGLAPDTDIIYSPAPTTDPAFWACASKITFDCAGEILSSDFFSIHLEAKCCRQLYRMGKKCNDVLVNDMLPVLDKDTKKMAYGIQKRCDHLWNRCLQVMSKY